ncbi:DNA-3-methyladenine glycosylase 2 family protein [Thaumasiovibrio subtropicus]|uniref:DNA-3-methyladenine glycosylase 2 family protein n=1 Tax=Thaumasiovibrio subtropicus TaxID=1891207 RepID=UPI000B35D988|nr:AlkA N-terminal domain-containing protein [Thaumasiovibrio subtropicus]
MDAHYYLKARLSRDARFDGLFFTAVKTTGIYCRPICPAPAAKEENVEYFPAASQAAAAGYRPCMRCRPDSAPGSPAWLGSHTTLRRALSLIEQQGLSHQALPAFCDRLGISERYLRHLFQEHVGMSPKTYAIYRQLLFAKQMLHESHLPITDIAFAAGFNSVRRFNDAFQQHFKLSPRQIRQSKVQNDNGELSLFLTFRPPYHWPSVRDFYAARAINGLEWVDEHSYGRTFTHHGETGHFTATFDEDKHGFHVAIVTDKPADLHLLIANIRRCLDLDADVAHIEQALTKAIGMPLDIAGIRLPGIWSPFEAGIRAILGQQVSVKAARNLVEKVIDSNPDNAEPYRYFPEPNAISEAFVRSLGMPERRKETLLTFINYAIENPIFDADALLKLKGIGPWTVDYLKLRGINDPDIFLSGDLGVQRAIKNLNARQDATAFNPDAAAPWRSYLTFYLWNVMDV